MINKLKQNYLKNKQKINKNLIINSILIRINYSYLILFAIDFLLENQ